MIRPLEVFFACSIITVASAQTGTLKVYLSPPAAQSTTVTGATTETFDTLTAGTIYTSYVSAIGSYSGPIGIMAFDVYGGATDSSHTSPTNYFGVGKDSNSTSPVTLTLTHPVSYFGFWWSAGDQYNRVDLRQGTNGVRHLQHPGHPHLSEQQQQRNGPQRNHQVPGQRLPRQSEHRFWH
jgi:hypothetical protein